MRTTSTLLAMEPRAETADKGVDEVIRTLTELIEIVSRDRGTEFPEIPPKKCWLDTEVDGARYLLVRIRRLGYNRIQLSPREQEIVRMVAKGHPNKVIADVLNISSWTVCTHLRHICCQTGGRLARCHRLPQLL